MRGNLCSRCPYSPLDLAGHYDPAGLLHVCAKSGRASSTAIIIATNPMQNA